MGKVFYFLKKEIPLLFLVGLALISICIHFNTKGKIKVHEFPNSKYKIYEKYNPFSFQIFRKWSDKFKFLAHKLDPSGEVAGIFLGDDSKINYEVRGDFKSAGIYHLLAASGFNCWIVSSFFIFISGLILHLLWFHIPSTILIQIRLHLFSVAGLCGAWIFFFWSDGSPPILRSAVMISFKYFLQFFYLRINWLRFLLVTYTLFLIFSPSLISNPSFQLTFYCLFGIAAMNLIGRFVKSKNYLINSVIKSILSSFGASLGAAPVTWWFFGEINFTSVLTNFFAIPIATLWIMPASLIAMLSLIFNSEVAIWFITIAKYGCLLLERLIQWYNDFGVHFRYVD